MFLSLAVSVTWALLTLQAHSSPVQRRRRDVSSSLGSFIIDIRTVIDVINVYEENQASASCFDPGLVSSYDQQGLDGQYAKTLLCEAAVGFDLFPLPDYAALQMSSALDALVSIRSHRQDPDLEQQCDFIDIDTFDNLGLNGSAIRSAICNAASTTSVFPTASATVPGTFSNSTGVMLSSASVPAISGTGTGRLQDSTLVSSSPITTAPTTMTFPSSTLGTGPTNSSSAQSSAWVPPYRNVTHSVHSSGFVQPSTTNNITVKTMTITLTITSTLWTQPQPYTISTYGTGSGYMTTSTVIINSTSTLDITRTWTADSSPSPKTSRLRPPWRWPHGHHPPFTYDPQWPSPTNNHPITPTAAIRSSLRADDCTDGWPGHPSALTPH